jgi:diacylglycerol kinase family enzyme
MPFPSVARALISAFRGGGIGGTFVVTEPGLTELRVSSPTPFPYQLDGDYLGETTQLDFRWQPDAVRLLLPG